MIFRNLAPLLLIIIHSNLLIHSSTIPPPPPFNLSHFLYPKVTAFTESSIPLQPPQFLQGVLDAIVNKEKWSMEDIRLSELDVKKVKYMQRYDFRVRVGKTEMVLKMYEEMSEWKKLVALRENGTSNLEALSREIGSTPVIDNFKIEGPFELQITRDDDHLSLMLPLNTSHTGLRRILVSEGITVEVRGAEEITILHPSDHQLLYGVFTYNNWKDVQPIWPALCTRLLPIRILGPASLVAYRTTRPHALIQTAFPSTDTIELLPERCYIWRKYDELRHLHSSLSTRIALLERVVRTLVTKRDNHKAVFGPVKTRIRPVYRLQLELERDIRSNDTYWSTLAEWRTRPSTERVLFDVVARFEGEVLKPVFIKKIRPLIDTDSFAWSSLSSNLSFTKMPSVFVPPEALTLDVKW